MLKECGFSHRKIDTKIVVNTIKGFYFNVLQERIFRESARIVLDLPPSCRSTFSLALSPIDDIISV